MSELSKRRLHKKNIKQETPCVCQSGQIKKLCGNLNQKNLQKSHKSLCKAKPPIKKTSKLSEQNKQGEVSKWS